MKYHCSKLWDEMCKSTGKDSHYNIFRPPILQNLTAISNEKTSTITFRLRTDHCGLNKRLYEIGLTNSPNCDCCHIPETVAHYLLFVCNTSTNAHASSQQLDLQFRLFFTFNVPDTRVAQWVRALS